MLLTVGAAVTFLLANVLGDILRRPPNWAVSLVATLSALAIIVGQGNPKGSPWRVPAEWQRAGHARFAGLFGFSLGLGFATNLPSVGFIVLLVLAAGATPVHVALLLAFGFSFGRVIPFLGVVYSNRERTQARLFDVVHRFEALAISARWAELAALLTLSVSLLTGS